MKVGWKRVFLVSACALLATYFVFAFTTFNKPDESGNICTKVSIDIADKASNGFIDAKEIKKRLDANGLNPIGKPLDKVDVRGIEDMLKRSPFVKTAQCSKNQGGGVSISITQRMPVVRIMADNGDDYYIDDKNCIMPNTAYTSDLIIATGNISRSFATNYISPFGRAIMADDLWRNLVEQIHVTADRGIEIVPRVGGHIVYLGHLPEARTRGRLQNAINAFTRTKMERLVKFYKYGLSQAGWNKYSYVDIEFDNQIICKKRPEFAVEHRPEPTPPTLPARPDSAHASQRNVTASSSEPATSRNEPSADSKKKEPGKAKPIDVKNAAGGQKKGKENAAKRQTKEEKNKKKKQNI